MEVAGIEPDLPYAKTPLKKRGEELSSKVLSKKLIGLSGTDRQILPRIVQRWSSLSDELKQAVLRVVGKGYLERRFYRYLHKQ